jgi:Cys-tRNA(Pro)/Cys-tRNA(Cys) deacylase
VYLDESALRNALISVSAGVRGTQILLAPADFARAVQATVVPIAKAKA